MKPAIERMKREYGFALNQPVYNKLVEAARTINPTDEEFYNLFENDTDVIFVLGDQHYTVADFVEFIKTNPDYFYMLSTESLDYKLNSFAYAKLRDVENRNLESKYPEFKHLVQEYRDGILLFEVSNKEVWERSSTDVEGLTAYFEQNKAKYKWDELRYKGYVVLVKDAKQSKKMQKEVKDMNPDDAAQYLMEHYRVGDVSYVKLEKGLFLKGDNAYVDEQVFHSGKAVVPEDYETFFIIGKLLPDYPESYTDVRGAVITDYQDYLEKEWMEELNNKYPIVVYEDVLRTVK
jgi:hypothetical protein